MSLFDASHESVNDPEPEQPLRQHPLQLRRTRAASYFFGPLRVYVMTLTGKELCRRTAVVTS